MAPQKRVSDVSTINNTGAGNYRNLVETSAEDYDELMDTNVRSTFLFTRHTVPVMLKQK
jgi:NAD(P)-dependent dehydrogenase (short-subunit alcohol dehydrogenase family)